MASDRSRSRITGALLAGLVAIATVVVVLIVRDGSGTEFRELTDETGTLTIAVPTGWDDVARSPLVIAGVERPYVQAAPDLDDYRRRSAAPGLEVLVLDGLDRDDIPQLLDETSERLQTSRECEQRQRRPFDTRGYEGSADVYSGCGPERVELWVLALAVPGGDAVLVLGIQAADPDIREQIIESVTGGD